MIKKLLLSILIFFIAYVLTIFNLPNIAGAIEQVLGIKGFNDYILNFKSTYDGVVTNIPSKDELNNVYNEVQSGAIQFKENFEMGVDYTKTQIDDIRGTLSGAKDTFNDMTDGYNETKEFIDTNSGVIQDIHDTVEKVKEITGTGINN